MQTLDISGIKMIKILHMVFIKSLELYKVKYLDFINKVLYMVVLMDYIQEVQLLVLLVVFKYLELLVIQILNTVFKYLELYKELIQVFIKHQVL